MKIGFIAMSGVRACDPELMRLGMTLPGFVERGKVIASLPSLGLLTLAGMTPPQHSCEYLEVKELCKLDGLPDRFDLVAISSLSAQINEAYELADRYRALGVPVVLGGLHVTALPEEAGRHADAVVVGEGEPVWLEVLEDAEAGRLKRSYRARRDFPLAECADSCLRAIGPREIQSPGRPGQPRLPPQVRILCELDPAHAPLQAEADRQSARRDRSDPFSLAPPVHRVRRRQCLREPAILEAVAP